MVQEGSRRFKKVEKLEEDSERFKKLQDGSRRFK